MNEQLNYTNEWIEKADLIFSGQELRPDLRINKLIF